MLEFINNRVRYDHIKCSNCDKDYPEHNIHICNNQIDAVQHPPIMEIKQTSPVKQFAISYECQDCQRYFTNELHPYPILSWGEQEVPSFDCPICSKRLIVKRIECKESLKINFPTDLVEHPPHYKQHPVECIEVTRHFNFNLGNAIKYIWRCDHKGKKIEDLKKAIWYLQDEIRRTENDKNV